MRDIILNILTLWIKPWYEKNARYSIIISEFRNKLPRPQNEAKKLSQEEKKILYEGNRSMQLATGLNLSSHTTSITDQDINQFYNELQYFNYDFIWFKSYYRSYTSNLNRLRPQAESKNLDLVVLHNILKDDPFHPTKPLPVLILHLKYKIGWTSKIYNRLKKKG